MNREQAKRILLLYRSGLADDGDPDFAAAMALVERDSELRRWFDAHRAVQNAIRREFRKIAPPEALKEQIVSERPWHTRPVKVGHLVAVAATVVVLAALAVWWSGLEPREDKSFAAYRSRMVSKALREYDMKLATDKLPSIREFLKQEGAPADFVLPRRLAQVTATGCLPVAWQGARVSMICFKTGRPLPPGQAGDLWFFIIDHAAVPDAPISLAPVLATVKGVKTASWTRDGKTYVLAVAGDERLLKEFL